MRGHLIFPVDGVAGGAPLSLRLCDGHNEPPGPGTLEISDEGRELLPASANEVPDPGIDVSQLDRL